MFLETLELCSDSEKVTKTFWGEAWSSAISRALLRLSSRICSNRCSPSALSHGILISSSPASSASLPTSSSLSPPAFLARLPLLPVSLCSLLPPKSRSSWQEIRLGLVTSELVLLRYYPIVVIGETSPPLSSCISPLLPLESRQAFGRNEDRRRNSRLGPGTESRCFPVDCREMLAVFLLLLRHYRQCWKPRNSKRTEVLTNCSRRTGTPYFVLGRIDFSEYGGCGSGLSFMMAGFNLSKEKGTIEI
ncbi:hypothetical protein V8E51_006532 [Hyaloscypha variabilis]